MNRSLISTIVCSMTLFAASAASAPWTLDSCINYAINHNLTIRSRQIEATSAELAVTEARDRVLPTADAGAQQTFNFGRGLTSDNTYADRNTGQFGWNIGVNLPLFQGLSVKRQIEYSKANLNTMLMQIEAAKDDVELQVISLYLQALYTRELHEIALEQVRISEVELARMEVLLEAGKIPALDLTQAKSQLAQDQMTAVNSSADHKIALLDLAQALQLDDADNFDIAPIDDSQTQIPNPEAVYSMALMSNNTIKANQLAIEATDRNIRLAKTGYFPRLSFNAGIGSSYYNISGISNPSFGRQMRDNFNKYLGFSLSIPIFDAFSTRNAIRRANVEKINAELRLEDSRSNLQKAIRQAALRAESASNKLNASIIARDAAREALDAMQEKYNFGRANATEFEQAKSTYIKAACEVVSARYESLLRTRILQFYQGDRATR